MSLQKDIINVLKDKRVKTLVKKFKEGEKEKRRVVPINLNDMDDTEEKTVRIKTGTVIDDLIGGGLLPKKSMLLFGEFGSGKSQTMYTMLARCDGHAILIDTEGTFSVKRMKQICLGQGIDWEEVKKKITVYKPIDWVEQMLIPSTLPSPADVEQPIKIIFVDSLSKLLRGIEFQGRDTLTMKQPLIREFIFELERLAKAYDCALVISTQIYESPNTAGFLAAWSTHKAVGGASLLHQLEYIIFLRRGQGNVRIAQLRDASDQPWGEKAFLITENGIENLPVTDKAEKIEEYVEERTAKQLNPVEMTKKEIKRREKEALKAEQLATSEEEPQEAS